MPDDVPVQRQQHLCQRCALLTCSLSTILMASAFVLVPLSQTVLTLQRASRLRLQQVAVALVVAAVEERVFVFVVVVAAAVEERVLVVVAVVERVSVAAVVEEPVFVVVAAAEVQVVTELAYPRPALAVQYLLELEIYPKPAEPAVAVALEAQNLLALDQLVLFAY